MNHWAQFDEWWHYLHRQGDTADNLRMLYRIKFVESVTRFQENGRWRMRATPSPEFTRRIREGDVFCRTMAAGGPLVELLPLVNLMGAGPKFFKPTAEEWDALANIELRVPWDMVRLPYEGFAVAVPDERVCRPWPDCTRTVALTGVIRDGVYALLGVGTHDATDVRCDFSQCFSTVDAEVEQCWNRPDLEVVRGVDGKDPGGAIGLTFMRVYLNACLVMTSLQHRLTPCAPTLHTELTEQAARGNHDQRRKAKKELDHMPYTVALDSTVRLYDTSPATGQPGDPTGRTTRPHWRRGHWAKLAVGAGRAERRLTFRRPCLVSAERLEGDPTLGTTTYQ